MSNTLTIQMSVEEINYIIGALSKHPYEEVAVLINNIREQAIKQINPQVQESVEHNPDTCSE